MKIWSTIDYYSYIKNKETLKLTGKYMGLEKENIILRGVVTIPKEQISQIRTVALTQWFIVSNMEFLLKAG